MTRLNNISRSLGFTRNAAIPKEASYPESKSERPWQIATMPQIEEQEQDWLKLSPSTTLLFGGQRPGLEYLDNFFQHDFIIQNKSYRTVEHYFQAAKFASSSPDYAEDIRNSKDGAEAKRLGAAKRLSREELDAWKNGKSTQAMKEALAAKYAPGSVLANALLRDTGDCILVEKVDDE